jgi:hypothetical protein
LKFNFQSFDWSIKRYIFFDWTEMKLFVLLCCLVVFVSSSPVSARSGSNFMGRVPKGLPNGYYCVACPTKLLVLNEYSDHFQLKNLLCNKLLHKFNCPCSSLVFVLIFLNKKSSFAP